MNLQQQGGQGGYGYYTQQSANIQQQNQGSIGSMRERQQSQAVPTASDIFNSNDFDLLSKGSSRGSVGSGLNRLNEEKISSEAGVVGVASAQGVKKPLPVRVDANSEVITPSAKKEGTEKTTATAAATAATTTATATAGEAIPSKAKEGNDKQQQQQQQQQQHQHKQQASKANESPVKKVDPLRTLTGTHKKVLLPRLESGKAASGEDDDEEEDPFVALIIKKGKNGGGEQRPGIM